MSGNLRDLAEMLDKKVAAIEARANNVAKAAAIAIVDDLVNNTPVDTSRALSNWQAGVNVETLVELPPRHPGYHGSTQSASAAETLEEARRVIEKKNHGEKVYIFNNVEYITGLNAGSSWQAPAGFVERAVMIGRDVVSSAWGAK